MLVHDYLECPHKKIFGLIGTLVLLAVLAAACAPAEPEATGDATLAIEHFSVIEGTTWSGAHDRAGKRIAEKFDGVDYVYREEQSVSEMFNILGYNV